MLVWLCWSVMSIFSEPADDSLIISGYTLDIATQQSILSKISIIEKKNNQTILSVMSKQNGAFFMESNHKKIDLKFECNGYRTLILPIDPKEIKLNKIICEVRLTKIDAQTKDQIYQQSTTIDYSIDNLKNASNSKSYHQFRVVDALSNQIIEADFELIPTRSEFRIYKKTDEENPEFTLVFGQKDIIAFEVSSKGYQKYIGNLIVENLDQKKHKNTIKLVRDLSILNIVFEDESLNKSEALSQISLFNENNEKVSLTFFENTFVATLNPAKKYTISIENQTETIVFESKSGINQQIILSKKPSMVEKKFERYNQTIMLYFKKSSYDLREDSKQTLDSIKVAMKEFSKLKIDITGHTDNVGDFNQNQYMSELRANKISNLLFYDGIHKNRMNIMGFGSKKPLVENDTEENRQKNRRVELKIYDK